jgi:LPS-assembly lipoprotein
MALLLTGCGFHLRGAPPLPPSFHEIGIQSSQPYGQLTLQLTQILNAMHVKVVPLTQHPAVVLVIDSEVFTSDTTTQSASSSTQQYIMYYIVTYHLANATGGTIFGPRTLKLSEPYSVNQNQVLSTGSVQQSLQQELEQEAVYQIIQQLGSQDAQTALNNLGQQPPKPKSAS